MATVLRLGFEKVPENVLVTAWHFLYLIIVTQSLNFWECRIVLSFWKLGHNCVCNVFRIPGFKEIDGKSLIYYCCDKFICTCVLWLLLHMSMSKWLQCLRLGFEKSQELCLSLHDALHLTVVFAMYSREFIWGQADHVYCCGHCASQAKQGAVGSSSTNTKWDDQLLAVSVLSSRWFPRYWIGE